ncbi:hypothetical protein OIV83_004415 [Microbotryomycetes sp. JL201]|nr:hypothetical protein OIV83_004415 [Microbotryomycetes sp. JL201]
MSRAHDSLQQAAADMLRNYPLGPVGDNYHAFREDLRVVLDEAGFASIVNGKLTCTSEATLDELRRDAEQTDLPKEKRELLKEIYDLQKDNDAWRKHRCDTLKLNVFHNMPTFTGSGMTMRAWTREFKKRADQCEAAYRSREWRRHLSKEPQAVYHEWIVKEKAEAIRDIVLDLLLGATETKAGKFFQPVFDQHLATTGDVSWTRLAGALVLYAGDEDVCVKDEIAPRKRRSSRSLLRAAGRCTSQDQEARSID